MTEITSAGWDGLYQLRYQDGTAVEVNDVIDDDDENEDRWYIVTGGKAPHKPSSSGFVWVKTRDGGKRELYAHALGMMWVRLP